MAPDLSLVRVFCAIYQARSVSRAADMLSLTQPAVSYSLGQLRQQLGDQLFIRSRGGMLPTHVADQVYDAFSGGLEQIDKAARAIRGFDPALSDRRFRVAMSDIGEMVYLPPLMAAFQAEAPSVGLDVLPVALEDTARALATGQLDCAIGHMPELGPDTNSAGIFVEHNECLFRPDHPIIGDRLTVEQFEDCRHIMVASPFSRHNIFAEMLSEMSRHQVAVQVVHFTSVPALVAGSDLVVTLPSRVARIFAATHGLQSLLLPFSLPPFEVKLHWHRRVETDPGHQWLRRVMIDMLSVL